MTKVSEISDDFIGRKVRVNGGEPFTLGEVWVSITSDTHFHGADTEPEQEYEESIYLWNGEKYQEVSGDDTIVTLVTGWASVFKDADGVATIAGKVYQSEQRAKEESLPGEKIAEVKFWA